MGKHVALPTEADRKREMDEIAREDREFWYNQMRAEEENDGYGW